MTDYSRPALRPLVLAFKSVLEAIDFGGDTYKAGIAGAPPCDPPYFIIMPIGSAGEGP